MKYIKTTCPVCGSENGFTFLQKYKYDNPLFAAGSIVHCNNCEMIFVDPMPDKEALQKYNAGYFDNAHGGVNKDKLTSAFISAVNLLRVIYVEHFNKEQNGSIRNILEIGPGGGQFAKHWLSRHDDIKGYTGVETDEVCYPNLKATGVKVFSSADELPVDQNYDLVVISHVLEHTSHPAEFINACTKYLLPGGTLFIEVPCKDFEHKGSVEPHLLFFDKKPMNIFLARRGFEKIHTSYHGNTIKDLKAKPSLFNKLYSKWRNFLLYRNITFPFSIKEHGLEEVSDPLERAAVKPFKAHIEQDEPSWWLRAIAIKK